MALRLEGWEILVAHTGNQAVTTARTQAPDAVVLDMMLPDFDGLEVLRKIRAHAADVPVLFLTARDAVEDRVTGLTAGGDDYVTKPFSLEEVVARLRALLRRTGAGARADVLALIVGDLTLDEDSHEVTRGGEEITSHRDRVRAAALPDAQPEAGAVQGTDPRPGLELRLRRSGERRGALHLLPAQEGRRRPYADDPHDAWGGVCPQARSLSPRPGPVHHCFQRCSRTTLTGRLVLTSIALVAGVSLVVGVVTTLALRSFLIERLDDQLAEAYGRAEGVYPGDSDALPGQLCVPDEQRPHGRIPGQGVGALTGVLGGSCSYAEIVDEQSGRPSSVSDDVLVALAAVPVDAAPHTVDLPGVGTYRVLLHESDGLVFVTGLPTGEVDETLGRLIGLEAIVALLGVGLAAVAGLALVRRQLRPLREVAATAAEVTRTPLDSGAVGTTARVPAEYTRPDNEVGQLGEALNLMLGHVERALDARHESEQQVRQFVADASHELRTPLSTIAGYAELSRRTRPTRTVSSPSCATRWAGSTSSRNG